MYHLQGRAVTSEGLYRSAIDGLEAAAAVPSFAPHVAHELSRATRAYSRLLADWDARELEAREYAEKAEHLAARLPRPPLASSSSRWVPLNATMGLA